MSLQPCRWPLAHLGQALGALAVQAGHPTPAVADPAGLLDEEALEASLGAAAGRAGLEVEPLVSEYADLEDTLRRVAPALLLLPDQEDPRLLLLLGARGRQATLLGPSGRRRRVPLEALRAALAAPYEDRFGPDIEALLEGVVPQGARRDRARRALLAERLSGARCGGIWMLRLPPSAPFLAQLREARLLPKAALVVGAHASHFLLFLVAWALVGAAALQGELQTGWLLAWGLLLLTTVPLQQLTTWSQGVFALEAGAILKRRLLLGALRLDPDEHRSEGVGLTMGRVNEAEAMEQLALSGGVVAALALLELLGAAWVLSLASPLLPVLLGAWLVLLSLVARRHLGHHRTWAAARLTMTGALVERMAGHRTRLAQVEPERWHEGEDQELSAYLLASQALDATGAHLRVSLPRGWLLLGLAGVGLLLVDGASTTPIALGLGGVLLAARALHALSLGLTWLAGALVAADQVRPLYEAAARPVVHGQAGALAMAPDAGALVQVRRLDFAYPGGQPVLRGCSLSLGRGDRVLLTGSSGGGKSTLAAVLLGLREPVGGLVLSGGLDRATLGEGGWRTRVSSAPQFHDNHVLANTFLFNLLMGRAWPPSQADVELAREVCEELGLGELLERMPGGLLQLVGETGWRLSHGEKSRLYIARTLLQDTDLIVLDESFAALDPPNLRRAMAAVHRRARALLVIAHP